MKKLTTVAIISAFIFSQTFIFSCENKEKTNNEDNTEISLKIKPNDTIEIKTKKAVKNELGSGNITMFFPETASLPLIIDTAYFSKALKKEAHKILKTEQVKQLTSSINNTDKFDYTKWNLKSFFKIDSIKEAGDYEQYKKELDIGEILYSDSYAIEKIKLTDKTYALIWLNTYSTHDACPYASGIDIYVSILYNEKISDFILVGEDYSSGDPPAGMSRAVYSELSEEMNITYKVNEVFEEEDFDTYESVEEKSDTTFNAKIFEGKISFK